MNIYFTSSAWEDFTFWLENDKRFAIKIKELIKSIKDNPFRGIGKPEPLKYNLKGYWSRRITGEHRLVYKITGEKGSNRQCIIIQCRFHYDDR